MPHSQLISRAMAATLKEVAGQGPDHVRTFVNQSVVTIVAERTLTQVETMLVASGSREAALDARRGIQARVRELMIPEVERHADGKVLAALSDHAVDPDVGVYVFLLGGEA